MNKHLVLKRLRTHLCMLVTTIVFSLVFLWSDTVASITEKNAENKNQALATITPAMIDDLAHTQSTHYTIKLDNFVMSDLNGLSTYLLSNAQNKHLQLQKSSETQLWFGQYLSVINTEYKLQSALSASQLQQTMQIFFQKQGVGISIEFTSESTQMTLTRKSNPYIPLLITWTFAALLLGAGILLVTRRQFLLYYLNDHERHANADAWLLIYKKAKFPLYFINTALHDKSVYWQQRKHDANEISQQAKSYFEAGDMATAKLLINKAMQTNSSDHTANQLIAKIHLNEQDKQVLSDTEQWIKSKIAKAMNNYRQQNFLKVLCQLHQVLQKAQQTAQQTGNLKEQVNVIKNLITSINQECIKDCQSVIIDCLNHETQIVLCHNNKVHLGRAHVPGDIPKISPQDASFYINHKQVSRVGNHCYVSKSASGFQLNDAGSKNGSFVNGAACHKQISVRLNNRDKIQLGSPHNITSVTLNVELSHTQEILQLSFSEPSLSLIDQQLLSQIWPDNTKAMRSKLVCIKQKCILAYNKIQKTIVILEDTQQELVMSENHKETNKDNFNAPFKEDTYAAICVIQLGEQALIAPIDTGQKEQLSINNEPVLGEIPLLLPCNISYAKMQFRLTDGINKNSDSSNNKLITT